MARPNRLHSVLRLAKRKEENAQRDAAAAGRRARDAGKGAEEQQRRLEEVASESQPISAAEFSKRRQRASLRADQAAEAEDRLREMLEEELIAREELRGAVRRRRSLEELESRRLATQAGIAAAAAQRALDELASMRQQREDESDDR
ncbi:MAG: hypothetical protein AAF480_02485 [Actinomycetota bacterium]